MDTTNKQIISIAVTKNEAAVWLETVVRNAFMYLQDYPKFMASDRDGTNGEWFGKFLSDCYDITLYRAPPRTPNCNAYIAGDPASISKTPRPHSISEINRSTKAILDAD